MILLRSLVRGIDWLAEQVGLVARWLALTLMLAITFEVTMRFGFNNPQKWSYDTTYMMGATLFLLPTAYVLLHRAHIRVDIFYNRYSPRMRKIVDLVFIFLLFSPGLGVFVQQSWKYAFLSLAQKEIAQMSYWQPTMIPIRFVVALGFSLLALEGVAWLTRELYSLVTGRSLVPTEEGRVKP